MRRTWAPVFAMLATGGVLLPAAPAEASCAGEPDPGSAPVVFVGTAESERRGYTRFAVDEVVAGPDLGRHVWVLSGREQPPWPWSMFSSVGSSTDAAFVQGERYVVGADRSFTTDVCTSTEAGADRGAGGRGPVPGGSTGATPPVDVLGLLLWPFGGVAVGVVAFGVLLGRRSSGGSHPIYFDTKPCQVCGAEVELRPRSAADAPDDGDRVGPADGVVGDADSTIDERICTNADCRTRAVDGIDP
jgi:hypothetical protein